MNQNATRDLNRRAWLVSCARAAVLGGIAVTGGVLVVRGQIGSCPDASRACASCGQFSRCDLPRAAAAHAQHAKQGNR